MAGGGNPPGIVGGVCVVDGGGTYGSEPFTGVLEVPERIPLALSDANMSPRLADNDGVDETGGAGCV